jgi:hypothetical protein
LSRSVFAWPSGGALLSARILSRLSAVSTPPPSPSPSVGYKLLALALVLLALLLAWGIWWYFDYKLQSLARPPAVL